MWRMLFGGMVTSCVCVCVHVCVCMCVCSCRVGLSHSSRIPSFDALAQTTQLDSSTSSATPISPLHAAAAPDLHSTGRAGIGVGVGGGGGGGGSRSLPQSPLLDPGMMGGDSRPASASAQQHPPHNTHQVHVGCKSCNYVYTCTYGVLFLLSYPCTDCCQYTHLLHFCRFSLPYHECPPSIPSPL